MCKEEDKAKAGARKKSKRVSNADRGSKRMSNAKIEEEDDFYLSELLPPVKCESDSAELTVGRIDLDMSANSEAD